MDDYMRMGSIINSNDLDNLLEGSQKLKEIEGFVDDSLRCLKKIELNDELNLYDAFKWPLRTKPKPEYIPFTADDWREFIGRSIFDKAGWMGKITWWREEDVEIDNEHYYTYGALLRLHFRKGNPCGKLITK